MILSKKYCINVKKDNLYIIILGVKSSFGSDLSNSELNRTVGGVESIQSTSQKHAQHQSNTSMTSSCNGGVGPNGEQESFNPVKVYAWFAAIPSLCKSIWLMAVAQHQFYLDKKQNRVCQ